MSFSTLLAKVAEIPPYQEGIAVDLQLIEVIQKSEEVLWHWLTTASNQPDHLQGFPLDCYCRSRIQPFSVRQILSLRTGILPFSYAYSDKELLTHLEKATAKARTSQAVELIGSIKHLNTMSKFGQAYLQLVTSLAKVSPVKCAILSGLPLEITTLLGSLSFDFLTIEVFVRDTQQDFHLRGSQRSRQSPDHALSLCLDACVKEDASCLIRKEGFKEIILSSPREWSDIRVRNISEYELETQLQRQGLRYCLTAPAIRELGSLCGFNEKNAQNIARRITYRLDKKSHPSQLSLAAKRNAEKLCRSFLIEACHGKIVSVPELLQLVLFSCVYALQLTRQNLSTEHFGFVISDLLVFLLRDSSLSFSISKCGEIPLPSAQNN